MLSSARELFVTAGYGATTMEHIAAEAGVAVQTLYYTFRTKGQLLRELTELTAAGEEGAPPVPERPWMRELLAAKSAQRVIALLVEHGADIYERAAPLWPALNAATAIDPEVGQYWQAVADGRRAAERRIMTHLEHLDALRDDVDVNRATDIIVVLFGHDVYRGLVVEAAWNLVSYKARLFRTLVQQLLRRTRLTPKAYSDLSFAEALENT
jgi:AcrR family transcriptional regulator